MNNEVFRIRAPVAQQPGEGCAYVQGRNGIGQHAHQHQLLPCGQVPIGAHGFLRGALAIAAFDGQQRYIPRRCSIGLLAREHAVGHQVQQFVLVFHPTPAPSTGYTFDDTLANAIRLASMEKFLQCRFFLGQNRCSTIRVDLSTRAARQKPETITLPALEV